MPKLKRPPLAVLVMLVLVAAFAAAIAWYEWFPRFRPDLATGEQYAVDVSHHQGDIDWTRVFAADVTAAYVKATEGVDQVDTRFSENWNEAASAGLQRGAYHFFTLCSPGRAQAEHFMTTVESVGSPSDATLAPAVDLELAGNCSQRPGAPEVRSQLLDFIAVVEERTGQRLVVYLGDDFDELYDVSSNVDRPWWLRRIGRRPTADDWLMWQYSGTGAVAGIDGPVDLNVIRSSVPTS